jgi:hypothetical protein
MLPGSAAPQPEPEDEPVGDVGTATPRRPVFKTLLIENQRAESV